MERGAQSAADRRRIAREQGGETGIDSGFLWGIVCAVFNADDDSGLQADSLRSGRAYLKKRAQLRQDAGTAGHLTG